MDESLIQPLPSDKIPRYLYKYRSMDPGQIEFTKRIITHRELYFASPLCFNDPFENYFSLDSDALEGYYGPALEYRRQRGSSHVPFRWIVEAMDKWRLNIRKEFLSKVGVISLSELCDNILLWSHYADSHKGVCLEFDIEESDEFLKEGALLPVAYSKSCPTANLDTKVLANAVVKSVNTKSGHWS